MRLYKEYGNGLPVRAEPGTQIRELPNLSYTHALILLGVPEEDRAQFISNTDIESMTTRELQRAVDELNQSRQEKESLEKTLAAEQEKTAQLAKERDGLKKEKEELQKSQLELQQTVDKKIQENQKLAESSNYKSYQRVSNELAATQIKVLTGRVAFRFENLDKALKELTYELGLLAKIDSEVHGEYKKNLNDFLIKAMQERMGS